MLRRYFGEVFQRSGRKGWYVRFTYAGNRYVRMVGTTKGDAETYLASVMRRVKAGLPPDEQNEQPEAIKFSKFVKTHLRYLEAEHAESTYQDEKNRINNILVPFFGPKVLSAIRAKDIERFMLERAEKGSSPATRNRYRNVLSVLFERAMVHGYVTANPVKRIRRLREEEHPVPALSVEEQNALIAACSPRIRDFALVALDTGCRAGELLRLEWKDVDAVEKELTVRKSKSGKSRTVPLTGRVLRRLTELRSDRVVPMEGPDRVFSWIAECWSGPTAKLFKVAAAAVGHPELRPHDLRHLCAVNLVRSGVPLTDVGRWLGHGPNSIMVTMRYARHAPANAADRARDMLEVRLNAAPVAAADAG